MKRIYISLQSARFIGKCFASHHHRLFHSEDMSNSEQDSSGNAAEAFISNILKPGSSLHPNFLRILDGAFVMLLAVLLAMLWLSSGNLHVVALIAIEVALWASVKWCVGIFWTV